MSATATANAPLQPQPPGKDAGKKKMKPTAYSAATDSTNRNALTRLARQSGIISLHRISKIFLQEIYQQKLEEVLRKSSLFTEKADRKRLFVTDVESALQSMGQNILFSANQKLKTCPSYARKTPKAEGAGKFHKGTVAKREVEKIRKKESGCLFVAKQNFRRYATTSVKKLNPAITFQEGALALLQVAVENTLSAITDGAAMIAERAKRTTVQPEDIALSAKLQGY